MKISKEMLIGGKCGNEFGMCEFLDYYVLSDGEFEADGQPRLHTVHCKKYNQEILRFKKCKSCK